jgi:hypothetical protein
MVHAPKRRRSSPKPTKLSELQALTKQLFKERDEALAASKSKDALLEDSRRGRAKAEAATRDLFRVCTLLGKREGLPESGGESFVDFVNRLAQERDRALAANQELARQAEAIPDVAARNACFAVLERELGEPSPTVADGISKLVEKLRAAKASSDDFAHRCFLVQKELQRADGGMGDADLHGRVRDIAAKLKRVEDDASQLRQALGLLSTLAPDVVMDAADPVGMAKLIEQEVRVQIAAARMASEVDDTLRACGRSKDASVALSILERRWPQDYKRPCGYDLGARAGTGNGTQMPGMIFHPDSVALSMRGEPLAGTGKGTQMPGGVAPAPGAKPVPVIVDMLAVARNDLEKLTQRRDRWRDRAEAAAMSATRNEAAAEQWRARAGSWRNLALEASANSNAALTLVRRLQEKVEQLQRGWLRRLLGLPAKATAPAAATTQPNSGPGGSVTP